MREKWICLPKGGGKKLAQDFNTSTVTVCHALGFKTHSEFAKLLRKAALERGGKVVSVN